MYGQPGYGQPGGQPQQYGGQPGVTPPLSFVPGPPPPEATAGPGPNSQPAMANPAYGGPDPSGYQAYSASQQYGAPAYGSQPFGGAPPGPGGQVPQGAEQIFMPNLSPLTLLAGGSGLLSGSGGQTWGSQYVQRVQQRMSWVSGGALTAYFNISGWYVKSKLTMLMAPYLKRWTYTRQQEQMQGGTHFRPPRVDINSPDLYIPVMACWAYALLVCLNSLLHATFKPDLMYATVWGASMAWVANVVVVWMLMRAMNLPTALSWLELFAYTGYSYVPACVTIVMAVIGGRWAWWGTWAYGSLCSAIFLVRTMQGVIFSEARNYGRDMSVVNYLLLGLAAWQFPLGMWLSNVPISHTVVNVIKAASQPGAPST